MSRPAHRAVVVAEAEITGQDQDVGDFHQFGQSQLMPGRAFGRLGDACQHAAELLQAIGRIADGVARALTGYDQVALGCEFVAEAGQETRSDGLGQTIARANWPAQHGLGADLVDVLPPWPATAGKREGEFPHWNLQAGCNG